MHSNLRRRCPACERRLKVGKLCEDALVWIPKGRAAVSREPEPTDHVGVGYVACGGKRNKLPPVASIIVQGGADPVKSIWLREGSGTWDWTTLGAKPNWPVCWNHTIGQDARGELLWGNSLQRICTSLSLRLLSVLPSLARRWGCLPLVDQTPPRGALNFSEKALEVAVFPEDKW